MRFFEGNRIIALDKRDLPEGLPIREVKRPMTPDGVVYVVEVDLSKPAVA